MRRPALRALMALTGVALLALYAAVGFLVYRLALFAWARRPAPATTAVVVLVSALTFGYVSYRLGLARIRSELDAVEVPRARSPELYRRLDALAERVGVETPTVLVARLEAPNALALGGPANGQVVLSDGLFRLLSVRELEAVVAHELAHLENRDGLVQTLGFSLVRTVAGVALLVLLPVAVVAGGLARGVAYLRGEHPASIDATVGRVRTAVTGLAVVVLVVFTLGLRAHSRRREYAADDRAVEVTGDPLALARGLAKIERATTPRGALSPLFIHGDEEGTLTRLLATHPPMDERIERLVAAARERGQLPANPEHRRVGGRRIPVR